MWGFFRSMAIKYIMQERVRSMTASLAMSGRNDRISDIRVYAYGSRGNIDQEIAILQAEAGQGSSGWLA